MTYKTQSLVLVSIVTAFALPVSYLKAQDSGASASATTGAQNASTANTPPSTSTTHQATSDSPAAAVTETRHEEQHADYGWLGLLGLLGLAGLTGRSRKERDIVVNRSVRAEDR
jgi:MYXO-CTERM domain-containing protein